MVKTGRHRPKKDIAHCQKAPLAKNSASIDAILAAIASLKTSMESPHDIIESTLSKLQTDIRSSEQHLDVID